jgi:phosphonate transport system permease protein
MNGAALGNNSTGKNHWTIPPWLSAILSIVPGLGQIVSGYFMRGLLLFVSVTSLFGLSLWRMDDADVRYKVFPPAIKTDPLSQPQTVALSYALLVIVLTVIVYVWNLYDGYCCASRKPAPARLGFAFISLAMLIIGTHITEINLGKAISEVGDVVPRLEQMIWPWDDVWERDTEIIEGVGNWESPCDDDPPPPTDPGEKQTYLVVEPTCGEPSGPRRPDGSREEGTRVQVQGFGFRPDEPAELIIAPSSIPEFRVRSEGQPFRVTPDSNGEVSFEFIMPNFNIPSTVVGAVPVRIILRQEQEVGRPYLNDEFWLALEGIVVTLFLALMATAVGMVLAVPLSFLAARNLMIGNPATYTLYYLIRLILNVVRSIEPIIWALIAIIWVGPGPFAGVIALALHTVASLGKLYSEAIESIEPGPIEAIQATGANRLQTIVYAIVPQVIPPFVSFSIYRWDINVRMSTILGAVGGGGIGFILIQWIRIADYDAVGVAVWMIAIVVTILDYASARIREHYV